MSDSDLCRATAAHYKRLAAHSLAPDVKSACLELESLWLDAATWTHLVASERLLVGAAANLPDNRGVEFTGE